ncbi:hypothetical protein EBV26_04975 [bacterium]|nr:hypothetical protein [bacterium]
MNPLKVKATGSPITSANISGLQTMTDAEVKNYIANVITEKFAADTSGAGTAEINITPNNDGAGVSIGNFVDTNRTEAIGTHPATGSVSTTTFYAKQVNTPQTENVSNRPVAWDSKIKQMSDSDIDGIMDLCIEAMVTESAYTAGQYKLQATAPSGGTWVSRYTLTDTAQGGNTVTYLWQKTVATSSPNSDFTPLRLFNGSNCKQMTESEIEQMLPNFRNRIIETGIGTYKIQSSAPSGGTWVQMGNQFSDTREQVSPQNYAGNYSGNFTGNYSGTYGGGASYSGTYSGFFSNTQNYTSNFTGNYAGTAGYSNTFSSAGNFAGPTYTAPLGPLVGYSGSYTGSPFYSAFYTGAGPNYSGSYAGVYTGSRNYAGNYAGPGATYSGVAYYSGSRTYSGTYAGTYANTFLGPGGNFAGPTYMGLLAYAGTYAGPTYSAAGGNFVGGYAGYFLGPANFGGPIRYAVEYQPDPYSGISQVPVQYQAFYSGTQSYTGYFIGFYSGGPGPGYAASYTGYYTGLGPSYTAYFTGLTYYTGYFSGNYAGSRNYAGNYAGPGPGYSGAVFYSGSRNYAGNYLGPWYTGYFSSTTNYQGQAYGTSYTGNYNGFVPPVPYTGYFSGPGGFYTGYFTGPANYSGSYQGTFSNTTNYTGNFTGNYGGVGSYTGNYSGTYINTFTGNYSGATIQATKDTVSTIKLWIRTA